jgi:hypothetical protein
MNEGIKTWLEREIREAMKKKEIFFKERKEEIRQAELSGIYYAYEKYLIKVKEAEEELKHETEKTYPNSSKYFKRKIDKVFNSKGEELKEYET